MKYNLNNASAQASKRSFGAAVKGLAPFMVGERRNVVLALLAIIVTSSSVLIAPLVIGHTVDTFIVNKNYHGVFIATLFLFVLYVSGLYTSYFQTKTMGGVGRRLLFNMRNALFNKLQELPVAFFNQNKAGDLISRINNDTDKLNLFFSQALMQFLSNAMLIAGAGVFLLVLNIKLGLAALVPAALVLITTRLISPWVKKKNLTSLQSLGGLSAEIQESLENFKVIVAFNRLDYFRQKFNEANQTNYTASINAGVANNIFIPLYGLSFNLAQIVVLAYGTYLISAGNLTVGLLIGFILYVNSFYNPLRQLATVWSSLQLALAGLDRISEVLAVETDLLVEPYSVNGSPDLLLEFKDVLFAYPNGKEVLRQVNLAFKPGHTYALVGPTGGGKTTTASLMARLYDPTSGTVFLSGRDIRSYEHKERTQKIGFILQEPFLFTGTVRDNLVYGNERYQDYSVEQVHAVLEKADLTKLLNRFEQGLETPVRATGDAISLGQKQIIAFIRAVLREPELLILDEATANIDTVTEQLLEEILKKLPPTTTKVIIAHRLNTIANADEIYFVNAGEVTLAGSMEHALEMLLKGRREG